MRKVILALAMFIFCSTNAFSAEKAGLGFEFGTSFYRLLQSNFSSGGANFFRLRILADKDIAYFLHNESGFINAEVGDAVAALTGNVRGIGVMKNFGDSIKLQLMTGSATINGVASAGTGTNNVAAIQSVAPVADLEANWQLKSNNAALSIGVAYRYHSLSNPIIFTDSNGKNEPITDMSALNINLGIGYYF